MKHDVNFEFECDGRNYIADCTVHFTSESYGSDADGNRGIHQVYADDVQINYLLDEVGADVPEAELDGLRSEVEEMALERVNQEI